jgi:glucose-6-phosphate isomerase
MLTKNIFYRNFKLNNSTQKKKIIKDFKELENNSNQVYESLKKNYKDSFNNQFLLKFKNFNNFKLIGMGGSILGAKAVYNFLEPKFKKFEFIDNFSEVNLEKIKQRKKLH